MAGITFSGNDLEQTVGLEILNLWKALEAVRERYWWLQANSGIFATLGISGDQTLITNAVGDLGGAAGLWSVAHAKFTPGGASDYFANAGKLTGLNYAGSAIA
jgi:hypothetical protein